MSPEPRNAEIRQAPSDSHGVANLAAEFFRSAIYSGLQQPAEGAAQLVDHIFDKSWQRHVHILQRPKAADFGTAAWHFQTIGNAVGMLAPFLVVGKIGGAVLGKSIAQDALVLSRQSAIGLGLKEAAATGFACDFLFKPSDSDNFWKGRLTNGTSGAASFTALTAGSMWLDHISGLSALEKYGLGTVLRNPIVSGIASGVPGGLASSLIDSAKTGHLSATDVGKSIYTMSVAGGALGLKAIVTAKPLNAKSIPFETKGSTMAVSYAQSVDRTSIEQNIPATTGEHLDTAENKAKQPIRDSLPINEPALKASDTSATMAVENAPAASSSKSRSQRPKEVYANKRSAPGGKENANPEIPLPDTGDPYKDLQLIFDPAFKRYQAQDSREDLDGYAKESPHHWFDGDYGGGYGRQYDRPNARVIDAYAAAQRLKTLLQESEPLRKLAPQTETGVSMEEARAILALRQHSNVEGEELAHLLSERGAAAEYSTKRIMQASGNFNERNMEELAQNSSKYARAVKTYEALGAMTFKIETLSYDQACAIQLLANENKINRTILKLPTCDPAVEFIAQTLIRNAYRSDITRNGLRELVRRSKIYADAKTTLDSIGSVAKGATDEISADEAMAVWSMKKENDFAGYGALSKVLIARGPVSQRMVDQVQVVGAYHIPTEKELKALPGLCRAALNAEALSAQYIKHPPQPEKTDPPYISLEEAQALKTLVANRTSVASSEAKVESLVKALSQRSEEAEVVARKVRTHYGDLTSEGLTALAADAVFAADGLRMVKAGKASGSAGQQAESADTISFEEAQASIALKHQAERKDLHQILSERGEAARWMTSQVEEMRQPLTADTYVALCNNAQRYVEAKQLLGTIDYSSRAPEQKLSVEEAQAVLSLFKLSQAEAAVALKKFGEHDGEILYTLKYQADNDDVSKELLAKAELTSDVKPQLEALRNSDKGNLPYASDLVFRHKLTNVKDCLTFARLWVNIDPPEGSASLIQEMMRCPWIEGIPDDALQPIFNHLLHTGEGVGDDTAERRLIAAAAAWQVEPEMPLSVAERVGLMPLKRRIAAGIAWHETAGGADHSRTANAEQSTSAKDNHEAAFWSRLVYRQQEGQAQLVSSLTKPEALLPAIELLHRQLSAKDQLAMAKSLSRNPDKFKIVASIRGTDFAQIKRKTDAVSSRGDTDAAIGLSLVFKAQWRSWLKQLDGDASDAGNWLPRTDPGKIEGLGTYLLQHAKNKLADLKTVASKWSDLSAEMRQQAPDQIVKAFKDSQPKGLKDSLKLDLNEDFSHLIESQGTELRKYEVAKDGRENLIFSAGDYPRFHKEGLTEIEVESRIVKLKGHNAVIVMPENYARELDELRHLRSLAAAESTANDSEDLWAESAAQATLAKHPLKSRLLPEQLAHILMRLPSPDRVKVIVMLDYPSPEDFFHSATYEPDFVSAADAASWTGTVRFFRDGADAPEAIKTMFHEWAHLIEGRLVGAFDASADLESEESKGFFSRHYAKRNRHENWAVHLGEDFLNPDFDFFHILANSAPLRTVVLSEALKQELLENTDPAASMYRDDILQRIKYVDEKVVPLARKRVEALLETEPPGSKMNQVLQLIDGLGKEAPDLLDRLGVNKKLLMATADRVLSDPNIIRYISLNGLTGAMGESPPQEFVDLLIRHAQSGGPAQYVATQALYRVNTLPARLEWLRLRIGQNSAQDNPDPMPVSIAGLMRNLPDVRQMTEAFIKGVESTSTQYKLTAVQSAIMPASDRAYMQLAVINGLERLNDPSLRESLKLDNAEFFDAYNKERAEQVYAKLAD